jgi:transcriptional regulator with XRE-family HTH domain
MRGANYSIFLQILIAQRLRVGITQVEVARVLGKPQSFVSKYERGERRLDFSEAISICEALSLDPRKLISEYLKQKKSG